MEIQTFSEEEKEEIIRYGLDKIKNSCMMSAVTLLMGYAFHVFLQSIVFLICFIALRKYAGGYHADTQKNKIIIHCLDNEDAKEIIKRFFEKCRNKNKSL